MAPLMLPQSPIPLVSATVPRTLDVRQRCIRVSAADSASHETAVTSSAVKLSQGTRRSVLSGLLGGAAVGTAPSLAAPAAQCVEVMGAAAARDPTINAGCATPEAVRLRSQIGGLIPPRTVELEVELLRARAALASCSTALEKHRLLVTLRETNEAAFVALLRSSVEELMPIVYTPTIADACLTWGSLLPRPTGLYISAADAGRVAAVLQHWQSEEVCVAVITDGSRVLGLGDLGAHGMGIPTGKTAVYIAAGAAPSWLLPVTLDVGTDNETLRTDPLYLGTPTTRVRGPRLEALVLELAEALQVRFRRRVLCHFEDFAASSAFQLLQATRALGSGVPAFNDDIEATGAVALAALLGATRVPGVPPLRSQVFLFFGAGQACLGTARLLVRELRAQGMPEADARGRIWMIDSRGLLLQGRAALTVEKAEFAQDPARLRGVLPADSSAAQQLAALVAVVGPTALIGAAAVPGVFGQPVIEALVQSTHASAGPQARPLVLALSNPTSSAEVSFTDALRWSKGKVVYASGSPFPPAGSSTQPLLPAQANNALVFPGLALGTLRSGAAVDDAMLLEAARAVAGCVSDDELAAECVLPRIGRLAHVTAVVADAVAVAGAAAAAGTSV